MSDVGTRSFIRTRVSKLFGLLLIVASVTAYFALFHATPEPQTEKKPILCGASFGRNNQEIDNFYKHNSKTLAKFKKIVFIHSTNDNLDISVKYSHNMEFVFLDRTVLYLDLSYKPSQHCNTSKTTPIWDATSSFDWTRISSSTMKFLTS
eukprot:TRINITY_DN1323_c0_g1_i3.p1 TRINITY_DN1323_c0_g1~~TRINITY_DN1323_c0_g1_i3.p1  ORF type:complete len:150 (-),score=18.54 TRINITY_DN1323_c0_g1_i3:504-953(-)